MLPCCPAAQEDDWCGRAARGGAGGLHVARWSLAGVPVPAQAGGRRQAAQVLVRITSHHCEH